MMTLEMFNKEILKGKTEEELYELLEGLKIEKTFLKVEIEKENIADFKLPPREMVSKINSYRLYIRDTYKHIEKISGTMNRTEDEAFALRFQDNIQYIQQIDFGMDGHFGEPKNYRLIFEKDQVILSKENRQEDGSIRKATVDKDPFLRELSKLYIGEWRDFYQASDYGITIVDGTSWELNFKFSNDTPPAEFRGLNAFPYNFGTLDKLIKKALNA